MTISQPFLDAVDPSGLLAASEVLVTGEGSLPSVYDVTGFVTAALASVATRISELHQLFGGKQSPVTVDRRLGSLWMIRSIAPISWGLPSVWDDLAGDYEALDGWIRLHTNAAAHRKAAIEVLQCPPIKEAAIAAVSKWRCDELESAIHQMGGVAGAMRSAADWSTHPQGHAVNTEPLVHTVDGVTAYPLRAVGSASRPLAGVRVLDLTKVLAGPVATRVLAMLGADVIRVDAAEWAEPGVSQDTTVGKRCVHIDGRTDDGKMQLRELLETADIFVHGYRPGALDALGLNAAERNELNPGVVEVSLNAYGHSGPWQHRRGFDSVVQMSCGIAATGMQVLGTDRPTPLPVQALDHVTGYLMASAALQGWINRCQTGRGSTHETSLARTALALMSGSAGDPMANMVPANPEVDSGDYLASIEPTFWGPARRLQPPISIPGVQLHWDRPAASLGSTRTPVRWLQ